MIQSGFSNMISYPIFFHLAHLPGRTQLLPHHQLTTINQNDNILQIVETAQIQVFDFIGITINHY